MAQVFISYARDVGLGEALAERVQSYLQKAGLMVFRDVTGIHGGDRWVVELEENLLSSDVIVLILSEKVRRSIWVHSEIDMATEAQIPVIPIFAEVIRLPLWLRHLQVLDFSQQFDWDGLLQTIDEHLKHPHPNFSLSQGEELKPLWAFEEGKDGFGWFADLMVGEVVQRLRWVVFADAPFWIADTACTQALWLAVMDNNPAEFRGDLDKPVERVSWTLVQNFLQRLNSLVDGLAARLPTEAEWEAACRAGTDTTYAFGKEVTREQVHFDANGTGAVKALPANAWGLYGMHGNVWEWCADDADTWGNLKVLRGGCWANPVEAVRSDTRGRSVRGNRDYTIGFRFVVA